MKRHLLIIEDDTAVRESLVELLELSGYEISSAVDGADGLDAILERNPDIVLCDINMPKMDGFEVLGALSQQLGPNEVMPAFLFVTARTEVKDIKEGLQLGADDYIIKPFKHEDLLERIELRLKKREALLSAGKQNSRTDNLRASFNKLALPQEDGWELVAFETIIRCEADRAYCHFHFVDGRSVLISKPMKEFEDVLLDHDFIKVHKSTIVNINFIKKYVRGKSGYLVMTDGSHVSVSIRRKEEVSSLLRDPS